MDDDRETLRLTIENEVMFQRIKELTKQNETLVSLVKQLDEDLTKEKREKQKYLNKLKSLSKL